ncbi:MAG TPA: winged helix-turn-helix domain-containing protein, partial [Thermoanaerobaculia bacterium]|nr:winged helix-turn-helix domain-containing protein [Thermoanaerobaculia bacterium]
MTRSGDEAPAVFRFDDFVIDRAGFRLLKGTEPQRIEPKAFEVLVYLVEHRDRVVMKQELLDAVWAGTAVTDNALTRTIAHIRKTLGDDQRAPRFIETVPTRGYRFIGVPAQPPATPQPVPPPKRSISPIIPITLLLIAIVAALAAIAIAVIVRVGPEVDHAIRKVGKAKAATLLPATRITKPGGMYLYPAFSPDGQSIAYAAARNGTLRLFRSALDGSAEEAIAGGEGGFQPSWSPNGRSIAFSKPGGGIWIADSGGKSRQLSPSGSRPVWSPDGNEIAYQTAEQVELSATIHEPMPPSQLSVVDVKSGRVRPLTRAGVPLGSHAWPSWRDDGRRIAFASCLPDNCAIYTIGSDGFAFRTVVRSNERLMAPVFDPAGTAIFYLQNRYGRS